MNPEAPMLPKSLQFSVHHGNRIHLGVTGSIAAYKAAELLRDFLHLDLLVGATLTAAAQRFISPLTFQSLGADPVHTDLWHGPDSAFGHLEPGQEASCLVIAPATANTIAKLACGLADEILCSQALAFPGPIIVAPAMNPRLYNAAATQQNLESLARRDIHLVEPRVGKMACNETGKGRLAELPDIVAATLSALTPKTLKGARVLVTLGPTHEYFDPARFWSNPSTGLMGACLAVAAWLRGAQVDVVHGPVDLWLPDAVTRHPVVSARQMHEACLDLWPQRTMAFMTAAVADFSPESFTGGKFKKRSLATDHFSIPFSVNPDILKSLGAEKKPGQILVGFCAETSDLAAHAKSKLVEKQCDLMVANSIISPDSGFAASTNAVTVLDANGRLESWPVLPKTEVAWRLTEWTCNLLS